MNANVSSQRALVMSYSHIESDPRVRRQIDWLRSEHWTVDSLGLGASDVNEVHRHYELLEPPKWSVSPFTLAAGSLLLSPRKYFERTLLDRIPQSLRGEAIAGKYDLFIFNEMEFLPWIEVLQESNTAATAAFHIDLHEYHRKDRRRDTFGGRLTSHHYRWRRGFIADPAFTSRTAVNSQIAGFYADEYGIEMPTAIRNIPAFVDQAPSPVNPAEIRLLFHGMASFSRGFDVMLEAMALLPANYSMTFMLMPNEAVHSWLQQEIDSHPAGERIRIVPPSPMREIAERINEYDLEIILFPPSSTNLQFALPNKFFESIQGRLGLVVGRNETMTPIVQEWRNGIIVPEFTGAALAHAVSEASVDDIAQLKMASDRAATHFNAENEGLAFLAEVFDRS